MTAPDDPAPLDETFECTFEFQPGWIDLTLRDGTKSEAKALATEVVNRLNPLGLEIEKSAVFDDMVERAVDLNDDVPTLAAAYYSEAGRPWPTSRSTRTETRASPAPARKRSSRCCCSGETRRSPARLRSLTSSWRRGLPCASRRCSRSSACSASAAS